MSVQDFVAGIARRAESQCRNDWTAVPLMRHVEFVWTAEHTMSTLSPSEGRAGSALNAEVADKITALQKLYDTLWHGSVGTGSREPKTRKPRGKHWVKEWRNDRRDGRCSPTVRPTIRGTSLRKKKTDDVPRTDLGTIGDATVAVGQGFGEQLGESIRSLLVRFPRR